MHALQARQSVAARPLVPLRAAPRVPRRAAAVAVAAYSPPSLRGATALDQLVAVSSVVPDTVLLGKTAASDAPTAATVSAAVLAGLAANPAAGVREFQVRKKVLSRNDLIHQLVVRRAAAAAAADENPPPARSRLRVRA